jgi:hypothetical protein
MNQPKLISCVCCSKSWLDYPSIPSACPWCFSSSVINKGRIKKDAIQFLVKAGIHDFTNWKYNER